MALSINCNTTVHATAHLLINIQAGNHADQRNVLIKLANDTFKGCGHTFEVKNSDGGNYISVDMYIRICDDARLSDDRDTLIDKLREYSEMTYVKYQKYLDHLYYQRLVDGNLA